MNDTYLKNITFSAPFLVDIKCTPIKVIDHITTQHYTIQNFEDFANLFLCYFLKISNNPTNEVTLMKDGQIIFSLSGDKFQIFNNVIPITNSNIIKITNLANDFKFLLKKYEIDTEEAINFILENKD